MAASQCVKGIVLHISEPCCLVGSLEAELLPQVVHSFQSILITPPGLLLGKDIRAGFSSNSPDVNHNIVRLTRWFEGEGTTCDPLGLF